MRIATAPDQSLPKQCGDWSDLTGAYRLLNNPRVEPAAIQQPHRRITRQRCAEQRIVLLVQDTTDLDFTRRRKVKHLGAIGNGQGRGILQHSTLALTEQGSILGVVDQGWHNRIEPPDDETRRQRQARWTEADVWADAVRAPPDGCRFIHICDRHADCYRFMDACEQHDVGFIVRAMHNRYVEQDTSRLWPLMQHKPVADTMTVQVRQQRAKSGRVIRKARAATVSIRFGHVQLQPPRNDPRCTEERGVWAVYVKEDDPPAEVQEPIEWMLLTSEAVPCLGQATQIIAWYEKRWVIEEWHRVQKEGCRLEKSQLDDAADIRRLAAIVGVVSGRLLQLRDLADAAGVAQPPHGRCADAIKRCPEADSPQVLQSFAPRLWIAVVSHLAKEPHPHRLTPRIFWRTIAKRGGWLGRKGDRRPGWKTIWRGWHDVALFVEGAAMPLRSKPTRCV